MRISTNQQASSIINQLNNVSGNLAKYQLQVSSGKKYESMSENPGATAQILSYNHVLSQLNRRKNRRNGSEITAKYGRNISFFYVYIHEPSKRFSLASN